MAKKSIAVAEHTATLTDLAEMARNAVNRPGRADTAAHLRGLREELLEAGRCDADRGSAHRG